MKEDPLLGNQPSLREPKTLCWDVLLPLVIMGGVLLTDLFLVHNVTITPLACAALISWMALRSTPRIVVLWAFLCVCATASFLSYDARYLTALQSPELTALLRTVATIITVSLAVAISIYRQNLTRNYQQVVTVLEKMPVPIIVSDETGTINFVNEKAAELLGLTPEEAPGHSYFSFLANPYEKGKSIQHYLGIFDSEEDAGLKLHIQLRKHPNKLISGTLMGLGRGNNRRLVTVIAEGPELPKGSHMPFLR